MPNDAIHIDVIWLPLKKQATRWMRQQRKVGVIHGTQDTLGLPLSGQSEFAMYRAYDQVQPFKDTAREAEGAIFIDLDLNTFSGSNYLNDFSCQVDSDTWQAFQILFFLHHLPHAGCQRIQHPGGIPIGANTERVLTINFKHIGDLIENDGYIGIMNKHQILLV